MITQQRLKECLHYDPETGIFTLVGRPRIKHGKKTGHERKDGYLEIRVDFKLYLAHRLAWLYMTGRWPSPKTDHKNGVRSDNRWENLREATNSFNMQNQRRARVNSSTGFLGVNVNGKGYQAVLELNGKRHRFGTYSTPEAAHAAYLEGKRKLHPGGTI